MPIHCGRFRLAEKMYSQLSSHRETDLGTVRGNSKYSDYRTFVFSFTSIQYMIPEMQTLLRRLMENNNVTQ